MLWQTIIGFVGFFTLLAFVQAAINITKPEPSIWPGLVLAAFVAALWWLIRRWRQ
nr:PEP-CTERM sorting domain-containing protein [Corynebacterium sp. CCUG 61414]